MHAPRIRDGLAWAYYWLDLYGPGENPRPANSKVLSTWAVFVALLSEMYWGFYLTQSRCISTGEATTCHDPIGVTWPYVWLVIGTLAFALGKDVFKSFLKVKTADGMQAMEDG